MMSQASNHRPRLVIAVLLLHTTTTHAYPPDVPECSLWIAPSTIPGAGLGLFAGKSYALHETITPGDLTVPLLDMHWHNDVDSFDHDHLFVWDEYTWADHSFLRMPEEGHEVFGASFGIGALPNCLFSSIQVDESLNRFDTAGLSRRYDPGAGAFTPYHDRYGYAIDDVGAGQELFVDYGRDYFLQDTRIASIGMVPFYESFELADELLQDLVDAFLAESQSPIPATVLSDLYQFIRTNVSNTWPSRTLRALPDLSGSTDFIEALQNLATNGTVSVDQARSIRSLSSLREQGTCVGNLHIRPSTVKQAGRGAFATQTIAAGHVVAAVPLLHIPDRSILKMHDIRSVGGGPVVHEQLLLNYCFGHPDSTLLLCPYGVATSAINHGAKPNVRIAWSHKLTLRPNWLEQPVEEWAYRYTAGLTWEYIALRDIAEGEEIFLDYGPAWVAAWKQHVAQWKPHDDPSVTEVELNAKFDSILLTVAEEFSSRTTKHPPNVELMCREEYRLMRGLRPSEKEQHRCRIRLRTDDLRYVAEIVTWVDKKSTEMCFLRVKEVLWDLPRDAFVFRDMPYTRDHAQYWSFRHELTIPDDLFPAVWRNRLRNNM